VEFRRPCQITPRRQADPVCQRDRIEMDEDLVNVEMLIRDETADDVDAITDVTVAAFESMEISDHTEQFIVAALRKAGALAISLVAEVQGRVVGHIAFSPVSISDGAQGWYGLGPVSVVPGYQRRGIGGALIQEGLARLRGREAKGCCLVGHPGYYGRFGFSNVVGLEHEGVPEEAFFALTFEGDLPQGRVTFHEAFMAREFEAADPADPQAAGMFAQLEAINSRPAPFEFYTADALWTDEHTSKKMLEYHLNGAVDLSSRKADFIHRSVQWIVSHLGIGENTSIADFGCGPGLYTTPLAETGADVTGIDFSQRSIRHAESVAAERDLSITYHKQNYLEFETEKRFDLITMIFCDFCALSPVQRRTLLARYYSFLKPGGAVLLDVHSLNTFHAREETALYERNQLDGFWSPRDYYGFLNTFKYDEEKVTLDKYTIVEEAGTRVVYNWLQYFSRESLEKEFEAAGFRVEAFYSDVAGSDFFPESPGLAIVALRPE